MITVYGIKNCDTMKKAFQWLDAQKITYTFHDYKKLGAEEQTLKEWLKLYPADTIINTKGITWKKLSDEEKALLKNTKELIRLAQDKTSMIKRPIVTDGKKYLIGFDPEEWTEAAWLRKA
jgi:arsenate reductase